MKAHKIFRILGKYTLYEYVMYIVHILNFIIIDRTPVSSTCSKPIFSAVDCWHFSLTVSIRVTTGQV